MRKQLDTNAAAKHLRKRSKAMAALLDACGEVKWTIDTNLFSALCESIIAQQISNRAMESVNKKFRALVKEITPQNVIRSGAEKISKCGISAKKCAWILAAAKKFESGEIDRRKLMKMSDTDEAQKLLELDGVGAWTVEMLMIFSLGKSDILSFGDFALRKGFAMLTGVEKVKKEDFEIFKRDCSPYATIAALCLWKLAEGDAKLKEQ